MYRAIVILQRFVPAMELRGTDRSQSLQPFPMRIEFSVADSGDGLAQKFSAIRNDAQLYIAS
jgi:hypothetical protein